MTARSLADSFRRLIAATGPISLAQFMGESNARYYAGKDPLGAGGDFITARQKISTQMNKRLWGIREGYKSQRLFFDESRCAALVRL